MNDMDVMLSRDPEYILLRACGHVNGVVAVGELSYRDGMDACNIILDARYLVKKLQRG